MESTATELVDPDLHSSFIGTYEDQGWDNESYIEIALETAVPNSHSYNDNEEEEDELQYRESSDNELQLRISFSSTVPFACPPSTGEGREENSSFSDEKVQKTTSTIKSRVQFPAVNRFLNAILSRPEIAASSKGSNISKRMEGGGMITKFLMKLRSKNIGALMESFLRPVQHQQHGHQVAVSSPPKKRGGNTQRRKSGSKNLLGNSGVFEINLAGIKRAVEPVSGQGRNGGSGSSKTSPVHPGEMNQMMMMMSRGAGGECSIQGAIAHCKSSYGYGQPSDFQFQTPHPQW